MRYVLGTVLALLVAVPVQAGDNKDKKAASSVPVKGTAENGPDVKKDVEALTTKITWQTSLETAKEIARREGRMVFWMNMLGDLCGAT
jgi:hypothetical protein